MKMLKSTGDSTTSVSKVIFFGGFLVVTGIMIYQTYLGHLSQDFFFWYILSTFGSNTLNKAISVSGEVLTKRKELEVLANAPEVVSEEVADEEDEGEIEEELEEVAEESQTVSEVTTAVSSTDGSPYKNLSNSVKYYVTPTRKE